MYPIIAITVAIITIINVITLASCLYHYYQHWYWYDDNSLKNNNNSNDSSDNNVDRNDTIIIKGEE